MDKQKSINADCHKFCLLCTPLLAYELTALVSDILKGSCLLVESSVRGIFKLGLTIRKGLL